MILAAVYPGFGSTNCYIPWIMDLICDIISIIGYIVSINRPLCHSIDILITIAVILAQILERIGISTPGWSCRHNLISSVTYPPAQCQVNLCLAVMIFVSIQPCLGS